MAEGYGRAEGLREFLLSEIGEKYGEIRATVLGHLQRGGVPTHTDRIMGNEVRGGGGGVARVWREEGLRVAFRGGKP